MEQLFKGNAWILEKDGDLGVLTFDLQGEKVNKFSETVLRELEDVVKVVSSKSSLKALLARSAKNNSFIVGADINVIKNLRDRAQALEASALGQKVFSQIEDLRIPTLVAIDGPCMGGGTEFSLAFKYRICSDSEKTAIALPEVKLGFLPGWGGTYRLPRLVGLMTATDMILTGKSIRSPKAEKLGLVHKVVPLAIFNETALQYGHLLAEGKFLPNVTGRKVSLQEKLLTENPLGKIIFFSKAKEGVMKATRGHYPSPLRSLELLSKHLGKERETFMKLEAQAFAELWETSVSKNLVDLFFLSENAKRNTGTSLSEAEVKSLKPIQQVGVLGAGVMGGGICYQSANSGINILMKDVNMEAVAKGLAHANDLFQGEVKKKRLIKNEAERRFNLIRGQVDYSGFGALDLVIEAIVENLEVKKKVFAELEEKVKSDCLIASNTSSLRLADMAQAFKDPSRFVGLHFFNPVHKMPLVEVITHKKASPKAIARAVAYSKAIGKTPVVVKDGPGFLVNRLLLPLLTEAAWCLWEGYSLEEMDKVMKNFGLPMGPFELLDEIGLDVIVKVGHVFHEAFGERAKPSPVVDRIVKSKRLGRKGGLGFYTWDKPAGRRIAADVENINKIVFEGKMPSRPEYTPESIVWRLIYPMVNEAAMVLKEGLVSGPDQVDLGMIFGTGFPPFRGGLLRYADSVGLNKIVAELERMSKLHGARLQPSAALKEFAVKGRFYT